MSLSAHRAPSGHRAPTWRSSVGLVVACAVVMAVGACGSDDAAAPADDPAPTTRPGPTTPTGPTTPAEPSTGPTTEPSTEPSSGATTGPAPSASIPSGGDALGPTAQQLVDVAIADLVERFDLDPTSTTIEVVSVDEVTWRDASLGCPEKDMQYAQVLTPGTRIILRHEGETFEYHAGAGRDPFYCARPQEPLPDS